MKILIVDDSKAMRSIVLRTLRQAGLGEHSYSEAGDGAEALSAIRQAPPDLVLADWNMPQMSGLELLQAVRADGLHMKFGFITTESSGDRRVEAHQAGAQFLITKPFTPETVRAALEPFLH